LATREKLRAVFDTNVDESDIIPLITADPEDDVIVACAMKGRATHVVTYDPDFDVLGGEYRGIRVLDGLHFLYVIRGEQRAV
jgi:predicted nucleic acid-binding protein